MRLKPFLFVACLLQAALPLAMSLGASSAEACSPPPPPDRYHTLGESFPGDGASNVPLDGALLFTSRGWRSEASYSHVGIGVHGVLTVTVTDLDTGEAVPGQLLSWEWASPAGEVWRPDAPLLPNRRYAYVASLQQSEPRPQEAEGPTELHGTFSTGAQLSPPLEFSGGLDVALESLERHRLSCSACSCTKVGQETFTQSRVRVPGVQGGNPIGGYQFELRATNETPYQFGVQPPHLSHEVLHSWNVGTSGEPTDSYYELHGHDSSYKPCFAWRAIDAAGNTLEGAPVCLQDEVPPPGFVPTLGCSVTPGQEGVRGTAFLALLGALLTVWRVRRRLPA